MTGPERQRIRTIRFGAVEDELLQRSAEAHGYSISDLVREAVVEWRERHGDRQGALEAWAQRLADEFGANAVLTARVNEVFSVDVEVDGAPLDDLMAEAVFDRREQVQLWVGDPTSDARAFLGRVRAISGAAVSVPIRSLPALGASDTHAV